MICPLSAGGRAGPASNQYGMDRKTSFGHRAVAAIIVITLMMAAWPGVSAAADVVVLDAQTVENLPAQNLWRASGGVHAMIGNLELYTDGLEVHMDASEVVAGGKVKILVKGKTAGEQGETGDQAKDTTAGGNTATDTDKERLLTGEDLQYNLKTSQGTLRNLATTENRLILNAGSVDLGDGFYRMSEGVITTCPLPRPEYVIQARRIDVYPDRYLEARGVLVKILGVPVLPLPVLRMSLAKKAVERYLRGELPIPIVDEIEEKGMFIGITYPYTIDEKNELQMKAEYSMKQGGQIGVARHYQATPDQELQIKAEYSAKRGAGLGVAHSYQVTPSLFVNGDINYYLKDGLSAGVAARQDLAGSRWTLDLSHRPTDSGYLRALPQLGWNGPALNIRGFSTASAPHGITLLSITPQASLGRFEEGKNGAQGLASRVRANRADLELAWRLPALSPVKKLSINIGGNARVSSYSTGESLRGTSTSVSMALDVSPAIQTSLSYNLTKANGTSPFVFDQPAPGETLTGGVTAQLNPYWQGLATAEYNLPQKKLTEVTYTLKPILHCFDVRFYYKQVSHQAGFGFRFK